MRKHLLVLASLALLLTGCKGAEQLLVDEPAAPGQVDILSAVAEGDSVQVVAGGASVYDRPAGTVVDFAPAGSRGLVIKIRDKSGESWSQVSFDDSFSGNIVLTDLLEPAGSSGGGPTPPDASFTYQASELAVTFTDTSTDEGAVVAWSWSFGDGATSSLQNPQYTYAAAGSYTVELTVTDDDGEQDLASQVVTVSETPVIMVDNVVIIGCSNTDNWLQHASADPDIELNSPGGQSGKTIVTYGEKLENKKVYDKFRSAVDAAGTDLDLAVYMVCQRFGVGARGARQQDQPYSLPKVESGSDIYSEKELVENILGEMRYILNSKGRQAVPVTAVAMHFYEPENGNTNPCERIGSNGILAQWSYVDEILEAGAFSSELRGSLTFDPVQLQNQAGSAWRMPSVSPDGDVTDGCHLSSTYVTGSLMPAFKQGLSNIN